VTFNLDLSTFWLQGDSITHAVLLLLVSMSLCSWAIILKKSLQLAHLQHWSAGAVDRFWNATDLTAGRAILNNLAAYIELVDRGEQARNNFRKHRQGAAANLDAELSLNEMVTRSLRQGLNRVTAELEKGQTFLASVGSVSPFVGLLGTVWGIYHALSVIGTTGQASLDKVAGPVGEALIMTAIGLFVAIPAVLAYNAFNRAQRMILADLDGFAHDLHVYFTLGGELNAPRGNNSATGTP
jgi:biopolymer transport protein ExbB